MKTALVLLMGSALILAGCGDAQGSPITPAPEGLTFLYFYTDA